ncbi:response regulator [Paenibacillus sp. S150]|uniref:response regulator n=1 Tax=Paenibacillus sp. S150 TaxID=2749826 RepID=UPI001C5A3085|nr:response regulator [Paenibacillus sp. S150]MBW4085073.1 response regulator [Paenibacillus sp. S150]
MNIALIDDEPGILEGLKLIVKRNLPECKVIGTAHNGVDGIRLIREKKPDIVLTDIRMPQADGLEMIGALKAGGCTARFIILSGYADFEYAKKGMQLGVQFYVTKPVEEEDLQRSVRSLIAEILGERARLRQMNELKEEIRSRTAEQMLRDILDAGSDSPAYLQELGGDYPFGRPGFRYLCALIEFDGLTELRPDKLQLLYGTLDSGLKAYKAVYRLRYVGSQVAVVVCHDKELDEARMVRSLEAVKNTVTLAAGLTLSVGVGSVCMGRDGIGKSFDEARQALSCKVLKGCGTVLSYSATVRSGGSRNAVPEQHIARLEACVDNEDTAGSVQVIREIFESLAADSSLSLADLQYQCLNILLSSVRKMPFHQLQQNDTLGRTILSLEGISRFRTLEQLRDWLTEIIGRIIEFKSVRNTAKKKDHIAEIKEYVSEHYHESISLAELSGRFYINPYYLSQLFKQKTGDTYLNYLINLRMGKAKELLEKTDLKVYEICQRVGYSDTNHFARLFERHTGRKPTEYRKNPAGR